MRVSKFDIPIISRKLWRSCGTSEDESYRISEFREFADEIPPAKVRHPDSGGIVGVVDRLALVTVVQQPSGH